MDPSLGSVAAVRTQMAACRIRRPHGVLYLTHNSQVLWPKNLPEEKVYNNCGQVAMPCLSNIMRMEAEQ